MADYIKIKRVKWIPGIVCFRVLETNIRFMRGRRYTKNDLYIIQSQMDLKIKRVK